MFMPTKIPDICKWWNNPLWQALAWDFDTCVINHTQMQDLKAGMRDLKIRNQCKINGVVRFAYILDYIQTL